MTLTLDDVKLEPAPETLNRDLVRKWVDALRSGEFKQTKGALERLVPSEGQGHPAGHCCLGVASVVAGVPRFLDTEGNVCFDGKTKIPSKGVSREFGFSRYGGAVDQFNPLVTIFGTHTDGLWALNDNHDWNFNQIADLIERDWLSE